MQSKLRVKEYTEMADVLTVYKLTPNSPDVDQDALYNKIKDEYCTEADVNFFGKKEEPGPFGIIYMILYIKSPDTDAGSDSLELFEKLLDQESKIQAWEMDMQTLASH